MPGLKKLKENIGRRWSLCSQNATQINFPRALLDTCPFCIESFYIEKKCIFTFLSSSEQKIFCTKVWKRQSVKSCSYFFRYRLFMRIYRKAKNEKVTKNEKLKKAVDVYVCPPLWIFLIIMQPYWNVSILISHYWSFPQPSYGGDV